MSAVKRFEYALGSDCPYLKRPLTDLSSIYLSEHDYANAASVGDRADKLLPPVIDTTEPLIKRADSTSWLTARKAYDAVCAHNFADASKLTDRLLSGDDFGHNSDAITQLINLAKLYIKLDRPLDAAAILMRLNVDTKHEPIDRSRVYILAEIALLPDLENDGLGQSWKAFEKSLQELRPQERAALLSGKTPDEDIARLSIGRSRDIALLYLQNAEPAKSMKILTTALSEYKAYTLPVSQIKAYLALVQIETGNFTSAQATIESGLAEATTTCGSWFVNTMPMLLDAYVSKGRSEDAIAMLQKALALGDHVLRPGEKDSLLIRLAELENQRGGYDKAEKALKQVQETGQMHQLLQLGYALSGQHRDDEAIGVLLEAAPRYAAFTESYDQAPLNLLLTLLEKKDSVDPKTVSSLIDMVSSLRPPDQLANQSAVAVERIINIVKKDSPGDSRLFDLNERLAQYYLQAGDVKTAIEVRKALAQGSEKSKDWKSFAAWLHVARDQIDSKQYAEASKSVLRALDSPTPDSNGIYEQTPGVLHGLLFIDELNAAGEYEAVEKILKRDIQVRVATYKATGDSGLADKEILAELYMQRGRYSEAESMVNDSLAALDIPNGAISQACHSGENPLLALYSVADGYVKANRPADAEALLLRLISIQKKYLGPKNKLFVESLLPLAAAYSAERNLDKAASTLREALDVACWNDGPYQYWSSRVRPAYAAVLRRMGRVHEAEQISVSNQVSLKDLDLDVLYGSRDKYGWRPEPPEKYVDTAERPLLEWIEQSASINGEGSEQTRKGIDRLVKFYAERKRFDRACQMLQRKLAIWQAIEGSCMRQQCKCMTELTDMCVRKGDLKQAKEWLRNAEKVELSFDSLAEQTVAFLDFGSLHLKLDERARGVDFLLKAKKILMAHGLGEVSDYPKLLERCIPLLDSAERKADADDLRVDLNNTKESLQGTRTFRF